MRTNFSCRTLQAHLNQQKFKLSLFPQKKPFERVHSFVTVQNLLVSTIVSTDAHFADFYDTYSMFVWVFQIKEVQQTVTEKTSSLEGEAFKTKRLQEELGLVKRKVERLRKIEMATDTNMDQILKEEVREYKETLTCPSCKVKRKDAVLTKCFHCFCYDCLRTRFAY